MGRNKQKHYTSLRVLIQLESKGLIVNINFGVVSVFRMLDKGIVEGLLEENEDSKYKEDNFSNIIYKIKEGVFGRLIKKVSTNLYDVLGLEHYIIITNYLIEVISK